ncbi:Hypothetical predicted protein [Cloeon dipterum]|uniref:Uncharacterized protein n=1 Tax=Cloeon dipterum TaxID=197152 RepID=A0A8S1C2S0_9INSE|nr:Hypothetical predicted protein [Cloeon dipterum]
MSLYLSGRRHKSCASYLTLIIDRPDILSGLNYGVLKSGLNNTTTKDLMPFYFLLARTQNTTKVALIFAELT